jgi:L-lactate dehydrogenase complex protein LldG
MQETTTREKIFKRIRHALIEKNENPFSEIDFDSSVFKTITESPDVTFAQQFTKIGGKFAYCEDLSDMAGKLKYIIQESKTKNVFCLEEKLKSVLEQNDIVFADQPGELLESGLGVTYCEYLVARHGSVVVSTRQHSGRRLNILPEIHVVVAYTSQLVNDLKDALINIKEKYDAGFPSAVTVISGPSRTADIEKTLVMGAHGPKELYVLLVEADQE